MKKDQGATDHLEYLSADEKIIVKRILKNRTGQHGQGRGYQIEEDKVLGSGGTYGKDSRVMWYV